MADTTAFDMQTTLTEVRAAAFSRTGGSYGLVYELWQQAFDHNLAVEVAARVPQAHQEAVLARLHDNGDIAPPEVFGRGEDECCHFLDAQTCPAGCFEGH